MKKKDYQDIAKKTQRSNSFLAIYLMRPISRIFVYYLAKTKIKPEHVVLISIFIGLFGSFLLIPQTYYLTIAAFVILFFRNILDCVDGDLARYKGLV